MGRSLIHLAVVCLFVCLVLESPTMVGGNEEHYIYRPIVVKPATTVGRPNGRIGGSVRISLKVYGTPARTPTGTPTETSAGIPARTPTGTSTGILGRIRTIVRSAQPSHHLSLSRRFRIRNPVLRASRRPAGQYRGAVRVNSTATRSLFSPSARVRIPVNYAVGPVRNKRRRKEPWDYTSARGPSKWPLLYASCTGLRQSPINIQTSHVHYSALEHISVINFRSYMTTFTVTYDGETMKATPRGRLYLEGIGVRGETYRVTDLHFHWSSRHYHGSEHAVNGVLFPMELHITTYMSSKYPSLEVAKKNKDGLAVLAVIFDLGISNPAMWSLIAATDLIKHVDDEVPVFGLDLRHLLPDRLDSYFRYHGSLTTPPCTENVIWTVFEHVQTLSSEQFVALQELRRGRLKGQDNTSENCRPLQATNRRAVVSNNRLFASKSLG